MERTLFAQGLPDTAETPTSEEVKGMNEVAFRMLATLEKRVGLADAGYIISKMMCTFVACMSNDDEAKALAMLAEMQELHKKLTLGTINASLAAQVAPAGEVTH